MVRVEGRVTRQSACAFTVELAVGYTPSWLYTWLYTFLIMPTLRGREYRVANSGVKLMLTCSTRPLTLEIMQLCMKFGTHFRCMVRFFVGVDVGCVYVICRISSIPVAFHDI